MDQFRTLRVRVTKEQYDNIKNKAGYYGFKTLSAFVRDALLRDIYYQQMLREIHAEVCKKL